MQVKADSIFFCIIDDCGDVDVPLLELLFDHLYLRQRIGQLQTPEDVDATQGILECKLSSDYYNRVLSGWEPIIEPWR